MEPGRVRTAHLKPEYYIVPTLRRGNAAGDAPASRNAGALLDEFPRRSVGTMQHALRDHGYISFNNRFCSEVFINVLK